MAENKNTEKYIHRFFFRETKNKTMLSIMPEIVKRKRAMLSREQRKSINS
ncbi:hypothetical protein [Treponema sp.]|nr:hypothetical protein [Treponema sp.]MBS7241614.1 hypothetical protein [Treponema sp.]MCI6441809.1 hypothetical protein [Spirochaetia bacterium]MDY4133095.1 hypothetical protein [Treponema sp.]